MTLREQLVAVKSIKILEQEMADENRLAPPALAYLERLLPRRFDPATPFE